MNKFRNIRFKLLILALCSLILLTIQGLSVQPVLARQAAAPRLVTFTTSNSNTPSACNLAAVSWSSPKRTFVFGIASNGTVWGRMLNGDTLTWDNWFQAASPVTGRRFECIGAASWAPGRIDIFGIDSSGYVWHKYLDGTVWGPAGTWEALGKPHCLYGPSESVQVVSWGPNRLDAFLSFGVANCGITWNGYGWSGWYEIMGGNVTTWGVNRLDNVGTWRTSSAGTYSVNHKYFDGTTWWPNPTSPWSGEDLGGDVGVSQPFSISRVNGGNYLLDIFVRDNVTKTIIYKAWTGTAWTNWTSLYGNTSVPFSAITGISPASNRMDIFEVRGGSVPGVYHRKSINGGWYGWEYIGGEVALEGIKLTSWASNRIDVFALRKTDGSLWHLAWNGSTWTPSIYGWEYIN